MTTGDYDFKFRTGYLLIALGSIVILLSVLLVPDSICLGAVAFLLLFGIGSVLLISAGLDSVKEWRGGNKNMKVMRVGLFVAMFFAWGVIAIFAPEPLELYLIIVFSVFLLCISYYLKWKYGRQGI